MPCGSVFLPYSIRSWTLHLLALHTLITFTGYFFIRYKRPTWKCSTLAGDSALAWILSGWTRTASLSKHWKFDPMMWVCAPKGKITIFIMYSHVFILPFISYVANIVFHQRIPLICSFPWLKAVRHEQIKYVYEIYWEKYDIFQCCLSGKTRYILIIPGDCYNK